MKIMTKDSRVKGAPLKRAFTNDELQEIFSYLMADAKKDDQMPAIDKLRGTEWFALLQDSENKKALISQIVEYIAASLAPVVGVALSLHRYDTVAALKENEDILKKEVLPKLKVIYSKFDPKFTDLIAYIKSIYETLELSLDNLDSELGDLSTNVSDSFTSLTTQITSFESNVTTLISNVSSSVSEIAEYLESGTIQNTITNYISESISGQTTSLEEYITEAVNTLRTLIEGYEVDVNTITEAEIDEFFE